MTPWTEVLAIAACLAGSAFFSSSETALLRMRRHQLEADLDTDNALSALAARRLVGSTGRLLVTILLGNNVTNIFAAAVASALAVRALGEEAGVVVSAIVLTFFVLVFCEVLPKAVAARNPRRVSYFVALPLYLAHRMATPVHWVFDRWLDPLIRRVAGPVEEDGGTREVLELARRLTVRVRPGSAGWLMSNVATAVDRTVGEVMTPRPEIVGMPFGTPVDELLDRMLREGYSRILVYRGSIDKVLGFVHFKDLVALQRSASGGFGSIIKRVALVPDSKPILDILAEMQRDAVPLAVVKDEFGVTVGVVTQEDVLEEFVGEMRDEFDPDAREPVRRIDDDRYVARGPTSVLDFNRVSGWSVPGPPGETLGGLIFDALGEAPEPDDEVTIDGYELRVLACEGTWIQEVEVLRLEAPEEEDEDVLDEEG